MLIESIGLKNFKCFEEVNVDFAPITLLTGANSSGKSSLINAILGIFQSKYFPQYLSLNGEYINMGGFDEVLWKNNKKRVIDIDIHFHDLFKTKWTENISNEQSLLDEVEVSWLERNENGKIERYSHLFKKQTGDMFRMTDFMSIKEYEEEKVQLPAHKVVYANRESVKIEYQELNNLNEIFERYDLGTEFRDIEEFGNNSFSYIGSYRLPPERTYYRKPNASKIGVSGEGYIDQIIDWEENNGLKFNQLLTALKEIGLFYEIKSNKIKGGRFEINVKVNEKSPLASLTDVGFGISQFLPIIVADLQLDDNSCLITSQPEIHLHPKIQASLANYFCKQIHQTKKQYIVETHSEYLLNRVRLLLVRGELKPEDVKLYYMENDGYKTTTYDIELTTDGQIKNAPKGFFETYEMDVMDIALAATEL